MGSGTFTLIPDVLVREGQDLCVSHCIRIYRWGMQSCLGTDSTSYRTETARGSVGPQNHRSETDSSLVSELTRLRDSYQNYNEGIL